MDEKQTFTKDDVIELIRADIHGNKLTQKAYAEMLKIQPSFLSEVLRGIRYPNTEILDRLNLNKIKIVRFERR